MSTKQTKKIKTIIIKHWKICLSIVLAGILLTLVYFMPQIAPTLKGILCLGFIISEFAAFLLLVTSFFEDQLIEWFINCTYLTLVLVILTFLISLEVIII